MHVIVNNISLHYAVEGSGNPLILLHGNGEDHNIFNSLTARLKENYKVYAIDSRNHGQSSKTDDVGYQAMVDDVIAFIDKLQLKDVSVLGFSDGAIVATMMELARPHIFIKMILLGMNLKPSDFTQESLEFVKEEYEKTKDPLLKLMLEEPNIELEQLKNIETRALVIYAQYDIYHPWLPQSIVDTMPNAQLLTIKGHDHGSYIIDNDMLYPYVVDFLK